ncbi:hypothetical protein [Georgenia satyanarayanai]|nr:hypothetical protein [Georgenia satyanarayanai]
MSARASPPEPRISIVPPECGLLERNALSMVPPTSAVATASG